MKRHSTKYSCDLIFILTVDYEALQAQQIQIMESLDAENKALTEKNASLMEWKRKLAGRPYVSFMKVCL